MKARGGQSSATPAAADVAWSSDSFLRQRGLSPSLFVVGPAAVARLLCRTFSARHARSQRTRGHGLEGLLRYALDIADPPRSFDVGQDGAGLRLIMEEDALEIVCLRERGLVRGYARRAELGPGACGGSCGAFRPGQ